MNDESLGRWISCIYRYGNSFMEKDLAESEIGSGHQPFLLAIYVTDGMSQDELSNVLNIDKATTTRAIKGLVELGYVVRKRDSGDKRVYRLSLTPEGKEIIPMLKKTRTLWTKVLTTGLAENERDFALDLLKRMAENAKVFKENGFRQKS